MRKISTVGVINEKTYTAESILGRGLAVTKGLADGGVTAVTVAGARCRGIVTVDQVRIGGASPVVRFGDVVAIAGGPCAQDDYLKCDAAGRVVPIVGTPGEEIIGRAESTATQLGDEVVVFVLPSVR